jgi:Spy/CpxP family protein refolding chaperone
MKNLKLALFGMMALFATATVAQEKQNNSGWQRTPEDQAKNTVERLDKQLKLSQNQKDSIYVYALDLSKKQQDLFKNTDDRKAAFEKIQPLRQTTDAKIKSFLTPEQSKSYDILQKEMQERRQQRQK